MSAAGPEHSKPLEKAESLFSQERDPRFGEIFPGISTGGSAGTALLSSSCLLLVTSFLLVPAPSLQWIALTPENLRAKTERKSN